MKNLMRRFWSDDAGFVLSSELLFYFVIVILGAAYGFGYLRMALVQEFAEAANNIIQLDNTMSIGGFLGNGTCIGQLNGYDALDTQAVFTVTTNLPSPSIDISANKTGACP
jgi:hypothetical protein